MPLVNAAPGLWRRLAARRIQLGKTQTEIEDEAGLGRTTLSRLEREDCPLVPRRSTIERLAEALRIPVERLLNRDHELDTLPLPEEGPKIAVHRNGAEHRRVWSKKRAAQEARQLARNEAKKKAARRKRRA